ncbi:unnamed protein product, partial [Discosporangium mesarthrocarpum]
ERREKLQGYVREAGLGGGRKAMAGARAGAWGGSDGNVEEDEDRDGNEDYMVEASVKDEIKMLEEKQGWLRDHFGWNPGVSVGNNPDEGDEEGSEIEGGFVFVNGLGTGAGSGPGAEARGGPGSRRSPRNWSPSSPTPTAVPAPAEVHCTGLGMDWVTSSPPKRQW